MNIIKGNLFSHDGKYIGHGCNTKGRMGAGIAKQFRSRYPEMYDAYSNLCYRDILKTGDVYPYHADGGTVVINLMTQDDTGASARLEWVYESVMAALEHIKRHEALAAENVKGYIPDYGLAVPWVGCGIGGLEIPDVAAVLERAESESGVPITVYEL